MATPQIALAQTSLNHMFSTIFSGFFAPLSITLQSPTLSPAIGFNNESTQSIMSGGIERVYALNIPEQYPSRVETMWPLILDYHGNQDTPHDQWDNSQYWDFTQGQDYLIAYPQGINLSWQGASYASPGVDDLQFTTDLIAHLTSTYNIDQTRIYASGKSNGGGFVDLLACSDNGDAFAAFAIAAAALYTDTRESACAKKRAMMSVHGLEDQTIPYDGGQGAGGEVPDISAWVGWWGERNCGSDAQAQTTQSNGYEITTYSCGSNGGSDDSMNVVQHYKVFELGHCWPSASGNNFDALLPGQATRQCQDTVLNYTAEVLGYFGQWNSNNAPQN